MDQSRALNALAPFIALAKSANSPRAATDLVTQATSATNTYIFAELLQQPNVRALQDHDEYGSYFTLLQCFAWGTWESYKDTPGLPKLSDAQALKLRLLSFLTIASQKSTSSTSNLSYQSLCTQLDLSSPTELEHLITQAIYRDLITGSLNPASRTVVITSVAPLRDLAPGSVKSMVLELQAWSGRCNSVLAGLEAEIRKVKLDAERRVKREAKAEKQIKAVVDNAEKPSSGGGGPLGPSKGGHNTRGPTKRSQADDDDDEDMMDVDDGGRAQAGDRKKSAGSSSGLLSRITGGRNSR